MVKISCVGLSNVDFERYRKSVTIVYGAQAKCRSCKRIRQTEREAQSGVDVPMITMVVEQPNLVKK